MTDAIETDETAAGAPPVGTGISCSYRPERSIGVLWVGARRAGSAPWRRTRSTIGEQPLTGGLVWHFHSGLGAEPPPRSGVRGRLTRYMRMGAGVGGDADIVRRLLESDIREILPRVSVPTLVLHRDGDRAIDVANAHYIAGTLPNATLSILPGEDTVLWAGDVDSVAGGGRGMASHHRGRLTVNRTNRHSTPNILISDHSPYA